MSRLDSQTQYSVTQITQHIKTRFESDLLLQDVWVKGEISNWNRSRTGHCYFTLKDARASIRAVLWRSLAERLPFRPQDGQSALAHGRISVYEPQGQYQLYVDALRPLGQGALYLQFEALKARLDAEGLFDPGRKRPLPWMPGGIGIVTSPTGAALRDVLNVLARRWPLVKVILAPTLVQGASAPPQIVAALQMLSARDDVDLIIVTRGGGSIEDLWAFNDERVARAIAASPAPVISGVGHETDFTIADFVADLRAPTPSAAAELATPDQSEIRAQLDALADALTQTIAQKIADMRRELRLKRQQLAAHSPVMHIERTRQRIDELAHRQDQAWQHRLALRRARLTSAIDRLDGLDPLATLARGYAIVRDQRGAVIRRAAQTSPGQTLHIHVSDGEFAARVE